MISIRFSAKSTAHSLPHNMRQEPSRPGVTPDLKAMTGLNPTDQRLVLINQALQELDTQVKSNQSNRPLQKIGSELSNALKHCVTPSRVPLAPVAWLSEEQDYKSTGILAWEAASNLHYEGRSATGLFRVAVFQTQPEASPKPTGPQSYTRITKATIPQKGEQVLDLELTETPGGLCKVIVSKRVWNNTFDKSELSVDMSESQKHSVNARAIGSVGIVLSTILDEMVDTQSIAGKRGPAFSESQSASPWVIPTPYISKFKPVERKPAVPPVAMVQKAISGYAGRLANPAIDICLLSCPQPQLLSETPFATPAGAAQRESGQNRILPGHIVDERLAIFSLNRQTARMQRLIYFDPEKNTYIFRGALYLGIGNRPVAEFRFGLDGSRAIRVRQPSIAEAAETNPEIGATDWTLSTENAFQDAAWTPAHAQTFAALVQFFNVALFSRQALSNTVFPDTCQPGGNEARRLRVLIPEMFKSGTNIASQVPLFLLKHVFSIQTDGEIPWTLAPGSRLDNTLFLGTRGHRSWDRFIEMIAGGTKVLDALAASGFIQLEYEQKKKTDPKFNKELKKAQGDKPDKQSYAKEDWDRVFAAIASGKSAEDACKGAYIDQATGERGDVKYATFKDYARRKLNFRKRYHAAQEEAKRPKQEVIRAEQAE